MGKVSGSCVVDAGLQHPPAPLDLLLPAGQPRGVARQPAGVARYSAGVARQPAGVAGHPDHQQLVVHPGQPQQHLSSDVHCVGYPCEEPEELGVGQGGWQLSQLQRLQQLKNYFICQHLPTVHC